MASIRSGDGSLLLRPGLAALVFGSSAVRRSIHGCSSQHPITANSTVDGALFFIQAFDMKKRLTFGQISGTNARSLAVVAGTATSHPVPIDQHLSSPSTSRPPNALPLAPTRGKRKNQKPIAGTRERVTALARRSRDMFVGPGWIYVLRGLQWRRTLKSGDVIGGRG
ncbi:hypothetical protein IWX90DRAFT_415935 [Phyllosticta citrichinensis]|uniref:Uncharacterized protein n=1 Tax=Phyllosticta citrichinensis TaxID=1130410 RepID=A0ABR1XRC2_9PEZI